MTPTYIVLLSITLIFSLIIYAYSTYTNEEKLDLVFNNSDNAQEDISITPKNIQDEFLGRLNKKESIRLEDNIEIELKLKKIKQQLNRSLKTLSYISHIQSGSSLNKDRLEDLNNLKQNVQYEVIRITKQINNYKTQIEDSVAA